MRISFLTLCLSLALFGCAAGNLVKLEVESPKPPKHASLRPVAISVSDDRLEVLRGDKQSWYLGQAPGDPSRDLLNHQLVPLHTQLREDLERELTSLGFSVVSDSKPRRLQVSIGDWRYDAVAEIQRYHIDIRVLAGKDGAVLAQSTVERNQAIGEYRETAARSAIRLVYINVVHGILRENEEVLGALKH